MPPSPLQRHCGTSVPEAALLRSTVCCFESPDERPEAPARKRPLRAGPEPGRLILLKGTVVPTAGHLTAHSLVKSATRNASRAEPKSTTSRET